MFKTDRMGTTTSCKRCGSDRVTWLE